MSRPSETKEPRSAVAQDQTHPVYVYGIMAAADGDSWPAMPGLGDPRSPVRTVAEGGIAALVSDLAPDHTPGRLEDLEAHRRVLAQAIKVGTAIPMRFGTVMDSDEVVRSRLLERHAPELSDVLRTLDGHIQMTVKAFYADDALVGDVLATQPDLARQAAALAEHPGPEMRTERVRFGELLAKAVEARRAEVESALLARLSALVSDVRVEPASSDRVAFSAHLLVHRDRRAALDDAIRELGDTLDGVLAFRYIGPLPPFSFADLSLEDGDDQWD
ncbi:MAG: hypothetical protein QOE86_2618 [Solirubrobacteraceae bacterium]|nr:hypothetical protein [Solirubrobacteraceae bacterium]